MIPVIVFVGEPISKRPSGGPSSLGPFELSPFELSPFEAVHGVDHAAPLLYHMGRYLRAA
jgi:hypothetical protein